MHGCAAGVKCMCTRRVKLKTGHQLKTMNAKNTKTLPIHENADANITCDFGVGDISRSVDQVRHNSSRYEMIVVTCSNGRVDFLP